ncbi:MAG TPA: AI-2E family transporter [Flavisolibacter sp.]|nr:AI-2E family transporter [Flavisolibacter sp.]
MRSVIVPFYIKLALILFILLALGYIAILGEKIFIPLLFSFLFAILLLPLAGLLENKFKLPRAGASIISVLLFIGSITFIIYLLGSQIASLTKDWPALKDQLSKLLVTTQDWISKTFHIDTQKLTTYIDNASDNALHSSTALIGTTFLSLSSLLLFLVFILIYTFFILYYRRLLVKFFTVAFSEKYAGLIAEILKEIKHIIKGYIVGLFFEMTIVSVIAISIFLILGIKYVFLLGLIIGVFNVIPYVGIFTALFISVSVTFATTDYRHALFVGISIVCIHLFDSNFLMPRIVGSHVKINPLIVILGVVAGEMLWGIPGMFLSIPYLAIAKVIFDRVEGMQPWGILLGEEEAPPRKIKPLAKWMKKK